LIDGHACWWIADGGRGRCTHPIRAGAGSPIRARRNTSRWPGAGRFLGEQARTLLHGAREELRRISRLPKGPGRPAEHVGSRSVTPSRAQRTRQAPRRRTGAAPARTAERSRAGQAPPPVVVGEAKVSGASRSQATGSPTVGQRRLGGQAARVTDGTRPPAAPSAVGGGERRLGGGRIGPGRPEQTASAEPIRAAPPGAGCRGRPGPGPRHVRVPAREARGTRPGGEDGRGDRRRGNSAAAPPGRHPGWRRRGRRASSENVARQCPSANPQMQVLVVGGERDRHGGSGQPWASSRRMACAVASKISAIGPRGRWKRRDASATAGPPQGLVAQEMRVQNGGDLQGEGSRSGQRDLGHGSSRACSSRSHALGLSWSMVPARCRTQQAQTAARARRPGPPPGRKPSAAYRSALPGDPAITSRASHATRAGRAGLLRPAARSAARASGPLSRRPRPASVPAQCRRRSAAAPATRRLRGRPDARGAAAHRAPAIAARAFSADGPPAATASPSRRQHRPVSMARSTCRTWRQPRSAPRRR